MNGRGTITRFMLTLAAVCFSVSQSSFAQSIEALIGGSCTVASKRNLSSRLSPRVLPLAALIVQKPVHGPAGIRTGIMYQQKGLKTEREAWVDSTQSHLATSEKTTLHYVSIPLQLLLHGPAGRERRWSLALGMNYCFLVYARTAGTTRTYKNNELTQETVYDHPGFVGFTPSREGSRRNDRSELNGFIPALRADAAYSLFARINAGCFYEYQLGDISSNTGNTKVHLHSFGITAAYTIRP